MDSVHHTEMNSTYYLQMKLFERKLHARMTTIKQEKINPKEIPESPDEVKEKPYCSFTFLIARKWIRSDINIMPSPVPIIFKLNSVHLERASSATLARNSEYKSVCLLRAGNNSLWLSFLCNSNFCVVCDHFSSALAYMLAMCNKSSLENPITDEAE